MVILGRLKSGVEVFDYFKAIYPRKARLEWALAHRYWTIDDWRKVIFSDESKINVWGSDRVEFYWSLPGSPLQPHHVIPTVKHGGRSVMVWACMTSHGVGYICEIYDGRMTASDYIHILKTELADTLHYYRLGDGDFIFQHDNDPKHTAKITTTYLIEEAKYPVLPWPSQSPDLNPIEHMWRHLNLKLTLYEQRARGVHELWERIKIEWETFDKDICCKYIDSMPARVQASNSNVAKQVGVSRTTVQKYRSSLKMSGNVNEAGRPSLISQRMVNYIRRLVTLGRKNNAVEIQKALKEEFGMSVSDSTVRRVLKKAGFIAFVKPQKPLLRMQNIIKRLQWAKSHQHWTVDDWKRVIFSDETKINRFASDGKAYTWKLPNEELNSRHVQQTVKHGGGNIMVWSCITWEGVGWIVDVGHLMAWILPK
ncbi:hypothetical protein G6F37_011935 [Rhizopus arrhizus]|nr:hypothetical protein G6F37_012437 [Rhizopus arrhizus]KAG1146612.1 hypothetical protein G6F37_011935 [Rhizopus arrhizus]